MNGGLWWAVLGAPLSATPAIEYFITGLWDLLRGGARVTQPTRADLSRRYAELLADNLGQPGFRELLIVAHDLDARQDLVFALLGGDWRRPFFLRRQTTGLDRRSAEAVDLAGASRDHVLDAVAGALTVARRDRCAADRVCGRRATGAGRRIGSPIGRPRSSASSKKSPAPACGR